MEAFLLAAGLGTRLRPLTNDRPKALVEVDGKTLLEINLRRLIEAGATRIVVNVHHFADKMVSFITSHTWDAEVAVSDESGMLLDTGGGLKKASDLFTKKNPILIHNVDILTDLDLGQIVSQHIDSMNIATLLVSQRDTARQLLFDDSDKLVGWCNRKSGEFLWTNRETNDYKPLAFSGIAIINPELPDLLPEADHPYPVVPEYLRLAKAHPIGCIQHDPQRWIDVGKPETLPLASHFLSGLQA